MASSAAPQNVVRPLSPFETFFTAGSVTVWLSATLRGRLDRAALVEALRAVRDAHPVLGHQIAVGDQGFLLVEGEGGAPSAFFADAAAIEEPELWPLTPGSGLVALNVLSAGDEHVVSFGTHHGVADARAAMYYNTQFWSAYARIVDTGSAPEQAAAPIPAAPEALLRERGVAELPTSGAERLEGSVWGGRPTPAAVFAEQEGRRILLEAATTEALRRAGKTKGVSLHGVVCGAVVKAERSLVAEPATGPVEIGLRSSADIRDRVAPPIGIVEGTNLVAMAHAKAVVDEASDPFEVGSRILGDLADDLKGGLVQQQIYHVLGDLGRPQAPALYITNVGALGALPTPDGLVVEDVRGVLATDAAAIAQLQAAQGSEASSGVASTYMVSAYGGRLAIEASYPRGAFTPAEIDRLVGAVESNLREMAAAE
ncbi:MAG: phthiocerol/phthiodiolone dimycocerosyl transferase family protein [Segniliparus sp.]|uniref:phthiocerol/phthiodiolone dimycocerosyl transferase family protein n=1 Tax=Segniliparus sp. TaxID=2804064 RepID=UPI003F38EA75